MNHFYLLPMEIRLMIYHECLVVGEIYPYSLSDAHQPDTGTARDKTRCDLPTVSLVQVSKTIRGEAEPMLYQRNVLRLGRAAVSVRFFERCLNTPYRRSWLKSVRMSLTFEDLGQTDREAVLVTQLGLARIRLLFPEDRGTPGTPFERQLHDAYKAFLSETVWPRKTLPILGDCKLEKLSVDLRKSRCQARCCDMRAQALVAFRKGFSMGMPKKLEIIGFGEEKSDAAKKLIRKWTSWRVAKCDLLNALDIFPNAGENWA